MAKYARIAAILAAVEANAGIEQAVVAADALKLSEMTWTPIEGQEVDETYIQPHMGGTAKRLVAKYATLACKVYATGAVAAGDLPGFAALLRGAGMALTVDAGVKVVATPVSTGFESLSIWGNFDGVERKMLHSRGNIKLSAPANQLPVLDCMFTGTYVPAADAVKPAVNYADWLSPLEVGPTHSDCLLDGVRLTFTSFEFDAGNQVEVRSYPGPEGEGIDIMDRAATASVTFYESDVSVKDWMTLASEGAKIPLDLVHGRASPNRLRLQAALAQVGKPSFGVDKGIRTITLPLALLPSSAGNDDWSLEIR
jgi:hypothetical protein